jgi:flagellar basal-body rod protein FlgG
MSGLIESATAILSASERRLETVASNVTNISTPGFKRQLSFADLLPGTTDGRGIVISPQARSDLAQGRLSETGNPLDLAISGPGFFRLRAGDAIVYSRQGQFRVAEDGLVVSPQGHVLQLAGGGDLVLGDPHAVRILPDGTVLDGERPLGRIGLFAPAGEAQFQPLAGSLFSLADDGADEVEGSQIRQRMVEASNVTLGDEMVTMMGTLRQAESGARIIQLYDELMGRAITTFGQGGR